MIILTATQVAAHYLANWVVNDSAELATIFSLQKWLEHVADQTTSDYLFLSYHQEKVLFNQIIRQESKALKLSSTAIAYLTTETQSAWHAIKNYDPNLEIAHQYFKANHALKLEERHFFKWINRFQTICKKRHWKSPVELIPTVIDIIKHYPELRPKSIVLLGFVFFTPLQNQLIQALKQYDIEIRIQKQLNSVIRNIKNKNIKKIKLYHCLDPETEVTILFKQFKKFNTAGSRFVAAFPDIDCYRPLLQRLARKANIKLGFGAIHESLLKESIIQTALLILTVTIRPIDLTALKTLLYSPFLAQSQTEFYARSYLIEKLSLRYDASQSQSKKARWRLDTLSTIDLENCAAFCHIWQKITDKLQPIINNRQSIDRWVIFFIEILQLSGWPGERVLNQREQAAHDQFLEIISNKLNSLNLILRTVSLKIALQHLNDLTQNYIFTFLADQEDRTETGQAILPILNLADAVGLPLTNLWIMGITNRSWPAAPKPYTMLPLGLQKFLKMAHVSPLSELKFAKRILERLYQQTEQTITFSYADHVDLAPTRDSTTAVMPSLLIEKYNYKKYKKHKKYHNNYIINNINNINNGLPLLPNEKIRGGSMILQDQADCPFRAFSRHRLNLKASSKIEMGLTAAQRGVIFHQTLAEFWKTVETHHALLTLDNIKLNQLINNILTTIFKHQNQFFYTTIEQARIQNRVLKFVAMEKNRKPFKVLSIEKTQKVHFAGLNFEIRIDRLDQLTTGEKILIDYKTGAATNYSIENWFGERPDDLQLPLYALLQTNYPDGLYFALLQSDPPKFIGVPNPRLLLFDSKNSSSNNKSSNIDLKRLLHNQEPYFTKLAQEFASGLATVTPKLPEKTCKHCDLQGFCRIYEITE